MIPPKHFDDVVLEFSPDFEHDSAVFSGSITSRPSLASIRHCAGTRRSAGSARIDGITTPATSQVIAVSRLRDEDQQL
jgi:hypothetical protein